MKRIFLFIVTVLITGCVDQSAQHADSPQEAEDSVEHKGAEEQQEKIESLQEEIELLKTEISDYQRFGTTLEEILNQNQLIDIAEAQWTYKMSINGKALKEYENWEDEISLPAEEIDIRLVERQPEFPLLPHDLHNQGDLDGFHEQIQVSPSSYEQSAPAGGAVTSIIYTFQTDEMNEDQILIEVEDRLKERLQIDQNMIEINID
ncbi:hypothetical protein [Salibacterium sp. K-3]